jgi:hypothetical protein
LQVAERHGLSAALFAPGWVREKHAEGELHCMRVFLPDCILAYAPGEALLLMLGAWQVAERHGLSAALFAPVWVAKGHAAGELPCMHMCAELTTGSCWCGASSR